MELSLYWNQVVHLINNITEIAAEIEWFVSGNHQTSHHNNRMIVHDDTRSKMHEIICFPGHVSMCKTDFIETKCTGRNYVTKLKHTLFIRFPLQTSSCCSSCEAPVLAKTILSSSLATPWSSTPHLFGQTKKDGINIFTTLPSFTRTTPSLDIEIQKYCGQLSRWC